MSVLIHTVCMWSKVFTHLQFQKLGIWWFLRVNVQLYITEYVNEENYDSFSNRNKLAGKSCNRDQKHNYQLCSVPGTQVFSNAYIFFEKFLDAEIQDISTSISIVDKLPKLKGGIMLMMKVTHM